MIRLWLSRGTATSIQEQLTGQFILGILSRRLKPAERLPSVRDLARRLKVHANTVSAVYESLAKQGWVNKRRGSGVFVRPFASSEALNTLELFVDSCMEEGLARGFSIEALRQSFLAYSRPTKQDLLVVDTDAQLARLLAREISNVSGRVIPFAGYHEASSLLRESTCVLITETLARKDLPLLRNTMCRTIQLKAMQEVLLEHQFLHSPLLVAVVSHSDSVLRWAGTLLAALGFSADAVLLRNPACPGWQDGLLACDLVAADVVSAPELTRVRNVAVFRIVADGFIAAIRDWIENAQYGSKLEPVSMGQDL